MELEKLSLKFQLFLGYLDYQTRNELTRNNLKTPSQTKVEAHTKEEMEKTEEIAFISILVVVVGSVALGLYALYRSVKKEDCNRNARGKHTV